MNYRSNHNKLSGGFPHSDISGSKPIPGSPKLNAGYHVLHRLLLPRHPPNALFALDLIQEEHDHQTSYAGDRLPEVNSMYFPATHTRRHELASVLDLEQYHPSGSNPRSSHTRDNQTILMLISLYDVKVPIPVELERHPLQDDQTHAVCLMIMQVFAIDRQFAGKLRSGGSRRT